jgi:hypothetical protein
MSTLQLSELRSRSRECGSIDDIVRILGNPDEIQTEKNPAVIERLAVVAARVQRPLLDEKRRLIYFACDAGHLVVIECKDGRLVVFESHNDRSRTKKKGEGEP